MADDDFKKFLEKKRAKPLSHYKELDLSLPVLETGIDALDFAMGDIGVDGTVGIRARSIMEVCGCPNVGKTSFVVNFIKKTIERYGPQSVFCLFTEHPEWHIFEDKGVDLEDIIVRFGYDPDLEGRKNLGEDQLQEVLEFSRRPEIKLIVIDSVSGIQTSTEMYEGSGTKDRDINSEPVAALAKLYNRFIGKFIVQNRYAVLCQTTHFKEPVNTSMVPIPSPDQIMTAAGRDKEFHARHRVLIRATKKMIEDEANIIEGTKSADTIRQNYVVFKRKTGAPRTSIAMLSMIDGKYNNEEKVIDYAVNFGTRMKKDKEVVTVSELKIPVASAGAWYYIGDEKFNGKPNAIEYLKQNPEIYQAIKKELIPRLDRCFENDLPDFSKDLDG